MKRLSYISIFLIVLLACNVSANFDFYGFTKDVNGTALNNTNVSMELYVQGGGGPPTLITTFNGTSNVTGWFNVSNITSNASYSYKPVVRHYNGTDADYVSQPLPDLPYADIDMGALNNITFYLKEGGTINITAVNESGGSVNFSYMVKDTKLGYPIAENFDSQASSALIYVPADRNYSIMLYPDMSFPISYDLNNLSDYAGNHADIIFNTTEEWRRVSGNMNLSNGTTGFDNITIINFVYEAGMLSQDHPMPYNISAWDNQTDYYNATSGFYNITLPGSAMTAKIMMFALARKGSSYYGAFRNISLNYSNVSVTSWGFNLTELLGNETNITIDKASMGSMGNITFLIKKVAFQLQNASGDAISQSAFTETEVDYTSLPDGANFKWMQDVTVSNAGILKLILLNGVGVKRMNIYSQQFAPKKTSFTASQLNNTGPVGINLSSNQDMGKGVGDESFSDLFIDMIQSSAACDVPGYNQSACSLFPSGEMNKSGPGFNPFKIVLGGGKISFVMRKDSNNITVHYKNVDMLASGPPDALFDDSANETGAGSNLEMAWRFGSMGPEIYDEVLIGIPLGQNVDFSAPISILIENLYDEDWNVIWNVDTNRTPNISTDLPTDYQDFNLSWFNKTVSGMTCSQSDNTSQCYINNQTGIAWLTIPHFSGIGPTVQSVSAGDVAMNASAASYDCTESCLVYFNITNNNYTIAQNLYNITISLLDVNGNIANITLYRHNTSAFEINATLSLNGTNATNSTNHTNYNLTRYNGSASTLHRYRLNVTKSANPGTRLNITYNITDLFALTLSLSLDCVESWTYSSWSTCSARAQARTATDANACGTTTNRLALSQSCTTGGGGGGGVARNPQTSKTWDKVTPGAAHIMKISSDDFGVKQISIEVHNKANNIKITIEKLPGKPASVTKEITGKVYKYMEIKKENLADDNVKGVVKIKFQVTRGWLLNNKLESDNIVLMRFVNGEWEELKTALLSTDNKYAYYEADSPGFSYFAIGEKGALVIVEEEVVEEEVVAEEPVEEEVVTVAEEEEEEPIEKPVKKKGISTLGVVLLVIAVIIVIVLIILSTTRKKKPKPV